MAGRTPLDWEILEAELYAAGADPAAVAEGARRLIAESGGHQPAEDGDASSPSPGPARRPATTMSRTRR